MAYARLAFAALVASVVAACAQHAPTGNAAEIRAIEERIYAPYLDEDLETGDVAIEDAAPWSNATRARIAEADHLVESTVFVFNPLTGSQEDIISNLRVGEPRLNADGIATVEIRFYFGSERIQHHEFIREEDAWRLNSIRSDDWELDTLLQAAIDEDREDRARNR
jgi:hypothetical protein